MIIYRHALKLTIAHTSAVVCCYAVDIYIIIYNDNSSNKRLFVSPTVRLTVFVRSYILLHLATIFFDLFLLFSCFFLVYLQVMYVTFNSLHCTRTT